MIRAHWPLCLLAGYMVSFLILYPLLDGLGIDGLEIHYRLLVIFLLTFVTFGGMILTVLPWWVVAPALLLLNGLYYGIKRKT